MTEFEALSKLKDIICKVSGKNIQIDINQDLRNDNILDSLDILLFFMELEKESGISIPETEELIQNGWYNIRKLCDELIKFHSDHDK